MKFLVRFTDRPNVTKLREDHRESHLEWLREHHAQIRIAGPVFDGERSVGAYWAVNAESQSEVQTLIQEDPFWKVGIRASVTILRWKNVLE